MESQTFPCFLSGPTNAHCDAFLSALMGVPLPINNGGAIGCVVLIGDVVLTGFVVIIGDVVLIANLKSCEFLHDGRALLSAEIGKRHEVIEHWVEDGTQNLHYCRLSKYEDAVLSPSDIAIADPIVTMLNAITNSYFTPQILRRIEEQCGPKPASNDYEVSNPCVNHSYIPLSPSR